MSNSVDDPSGYPDIRPGQEPLTPAEKDAFLGRVRAQGRSLTADEQYALFGPPPKAETPALRHTDVAEMTAALLDDTQIGRLQANFFDDLPDDALPPVQLVVGVIFDLDDTLAVPTRPPDEMMAEGAVNAVAYMRSTGMELPDDFHQNVVEARLFAAEKSDEEQEEHIADDAMSFLLQFFGYPASVMEPAVLTRAVDLFYAPEMTGWALRPGVRELLEHLAAAGIRLALMSHHSSDRVFQRIVDFLKLRPYFDLCVSSAGIEFRKPDARFFQAALDRWDALPYEVVVVGDSLVHDIQGGLALGALTIQTLLPTTAQIAHQNAQVAGQIAADAVADDLAQIEALVLAWARA